MLGLQRTAGNAAVARLAGARDPWAPVRSARGRSLARCGAGGCSCGGTCRDEEEELGAGRIALRRAIAGRTLARQAVHYRDCVPAVTGVPNADELLENGRQRARRFVGSALRRLRAAPTPGSTYETALNRHFATPSAAERATIRANFEQILRTLRVSNYICNSQNICGTEQAFWIASDDLVHVCRPFWTLSPTCRAIILIHEGAHDIGVDAAIAGHPPNRGDAEYPTGNTAAPAGETAALRIQNPDAYAFFAAHVFRDTDTGFTCF